VQSPSDSICFHIETAQVAQVACYDRRTSFTFQSKQFCSFLTLYLVLLCLGSLLLPRQWFLALMKIGFPFLPETLQEDNHD
jgi:hypothetical protein